MAELSLPQCLTHDEEVQRVLDDLVAEGLLQRRRRKDGRIGYWATPRGLADGPGPNA